MKSNEGKLELSW